MKRFGVSTLALLAALAVFSCSSGGGEKAAWTVCVGSEPTTIDPALNSSLDGSIYLVHFFEGLMRFKDNGAGVAVSDYGLAQSYEKEILDDGKVVYTFHLRDGLKWSDGKEFTAEDFVYTWQRLVDPSTVADYSYMIDMVVNANEIMAGKADKSTLGITAPDAQTVEITLINDCAYFMEIAAFPATYPVRKDSIEKNGDQWTFKNYISNGAYRLKKWQHNGYILAEKNPNYYRSITGPETIKFSLMDDNNAMLAGFKNGDIDFLDNFPVAEIPTLMKDGTVKVAGMLGNYYVTINNQKAPFNDVRVRRAFSLAVDRNYMVENITRTGEMPASGMVPFSVLDAAPGSDFRKIGGDYYSTAKSDYEANIAEAKRLMAEAGYPDGAGFPVVEYSYNTNDRHREIAEALQNMWQTNLGVSVTLSNQEWAVFLESRKKGDYTIARDGWIADFNDPVTFLDMFTTGNGNNDPQYKNPRFDALIENAKKAVNPEVRMNALHQAEDVLMDEDAAVIPVYFYTQPYAMAKRGSGMYLTPLGYFFFDEVKLQK